MSRFAYPLAYPNRQTGAALIVALLMLIAVLSLGISASRIALQGEKAARNERDHQIALQAAEAALLDAEMDIEESPDASRSRSYLFAHDRTEGFVEGCASAAGGDYFGLCMRAGSGAPVWQTTDFLDQSANARAVPYGRFTGQTFQTGHGSLSARAPRYIIELMPYNRAGEGATGQDLTYFYRITAVGFGARESTQAVLQTFYRKHGK